MTGFHRNAWTARRSGRGIRRSSGWLAAGAAAALVWGACAGSASAEIQQELAPNLAFHARGPRGFRRLSSSGRPGEYREVWTGGGLRLEAEVRIAPQIADAWGYWEQAQQAAAARRRRMRALKLTSSDQLGIVQRTSGAPGEILHVRQNLFARVSASRPSTLSKREPLYALAEDLCRRIQWQQYATDAVANQGIRDSALPAGFRRVDQWAQLDEGPANGRVLTVVWRRGGSDIRLRMEYFESRWGMLRRVSEFLPGLAGQERPSDAAVQTLYRLRRKPGRRLYLAMAPLAQALALVELRGSICADQPDLVGLGVVRGIGLPQESASDIPRELRRKSASPFPSMVPPPEVRRGAAAAAPQRQPAAQPSSAGGAIGLILAAAGLIGAGLLLGLGLWTTSRRRRAGGESEPS